MRKWYFLLLSLLISVQLGCLFAEEKKAKPLFIIGGGYLDTRNYSCGLLQIEYKWHHSLWHHLRPQAILLLSQLGSGYIGFGLGWECYLTKHFVVIPSFSPGIYWKGKGRDLGSPLEFRSALELSYEMENQMRVGIQISHVSNAHLSHRNPGFNAIVMSVAIPLNLSSVLSRNVEK